MPSDVPDLDIRVNGARLPVAALADIAGVRVEEDLDALSMFTLELRNWDPDRAAVSWSDSSVFAVGNEVTISLGFVDDLHPVMLGEITGLEPAFTSERPPTLTVRGYDLRHRLARGRRTRTFARMKDSAIATEVARAAGLRPQVTDTGNVLEYVVQHNQSDLDFLRTRAGLIGYEVYVRDRMLYFRPPPTTGQPALTLDAARDLDTFSPRLNALAPTGASTVRGWDPKRKTAVVGTAGAGGERPMGKTLGARQADRAFGTTTTPVVDEPAADRARADQMARGRFTDRALGWIEGEADGPGLATLHAGSVVAITGAGTRFSGRYYVTAVSHSLLPDEGFRTSFDVRRNAS